MAQKNWADKQNKFCDDCYSMPLPIENWEKTVEHKASFAVEAQLPHSQDLRYCCVYKNLFLKSQNKKHIRENTNWNMTKGVMLRLVPVREEDYLEAVTTIAAIYDKCKKDMVVVIPQLFREGLWTKFKEFHLPFFLSELEKQGIPYCDSLSDEMLNKKRKYVLVFSVATSKELMEKVLLDYLKTGNYKNKGIISLSVLYGEKHLSLKNVYPTE